MFYLKAKLVKNIGWLKYFSANIAGVDQDLCIKYATGQNFNDSDDHPEPREDRGRCQPDASAAKLEKDFCRQEISQVKVELGKKKKIK